MKRCYKNLLIPVMALTIGLNPFYAIAEDIDIFTGASAGIADRPNVLIVLDNTSNWSRQSQQWPGGLAQGQAEVRSIKSVLDSIGTDINVGIMEFVTNGDANKTGGFIRFPILQMDAVNKAALKAELDEISANINSEKEKRNSGTAYGNLMYDVYNYFAGSDVGTNSRDLPLPSDRVDARGYDALYTNFKTPLSSTKSCAKNYVIFIGNPDASGPSADQEPYNKTALESLGCNTSNISLPNFNKTSTVSETNIGTSKFCYGNASTCNANPNEVFPNPLDESGKPIYSDIKCGTAIAEVSCGGDTQRYSVYAKDNQGSKSLGTLASCVQNSAKCQDAISSLYGAQCQGSGVSCSCTNQTTSGCSGNGSEKYNYTITRSKSFTEIVNLGYSNACLSPNPTYAGADYAETCNKYASYASGSGCYYDAPTLIASSCTVPGESKFSIVGETAVTTATPNGTYDPSLGLNWNLDEWARCMYQKGFPVNGGANQFASVYTIDVYNAQQNDKHTSLLLSTAHQGGGKYFSATNEGALLNSLKQIFAEIQSVNSTFASASLPVNATNRAQNENQVFIGMFRPDSNMQPRWYGNLKRYQLVTEADGVTVNLGDKNGNIAVNNQTGFITDCAVSYWTTDSLIDPTDASKGYYWSNIANPNAASKCEGLAMGQIYSDLPDGPTVEKGAVAEVLRKGNLPPTTDNTPTWKANRTVYTTTSPLGTALSSLSAADSLSAVQKLWVTGIDTEGDDPSPPGALPDKELIEIRSFMHGDVVHSRPLPVTYGEGDGVVFYGANDGMLRAVDAESGKELWAFMPFEFAQANFVDRLRNNMPLIKYPSTDMTISPSPIPKTYGWDGSIGIAQNADNSKVWIYPTMRRGGRMVYGLNVTNKAVPSILWKHGCYGDDCTGSFENMGQTWSAPLVAPVAGYENEKIALFGGGYDLCEDEDTASPNCASPRGANLYIVDAGNGILLKKFSTSRSVVSEVAVVDMNNDGKADYAYVGDTGGNLYRIDMVTIVKSSGATLYTPRAPDDWTMHKIGQAGGGRKFMFQPAVLPLGRDGRVYVALGSGDREHPLASNYPFSEVTNRFYVYLDDLTKTDLINLNDLSDKTVDAGCASTSILPSSTVRGWYMDLNQYGPGEQTVTSAVIIAGQVVFSTNRPLPPAAGTCATVLGEARGYWVNLFNASGTISASPVVCDGTRSSTFVGGGLPPSPVVGNVMVDGKPVSVVIGAADHDGGASTPISPTKLVPAVKPVRKRIYHKQKGVD